MPRTHGLSGRNKRLYKIWKEMRYRCNNPSNKSYYRYGGRGIKVCDEWNNSFVPFYEWANIVGINAHCLLHRKDMGWEMEDILTTPLGGKRKK